MPAFMFFLAGAVVGALMPVQSAANARLSHILGGPTWAAAASLGIAIACVAVGSVAARSTPPALSILREAPLWTWSGGLIGAIIVFAGIVLLPRIGVSAFMTAIIAGQLASGALIDRFGLFGLSPQPVNGWRAIGLICIALGAFAIARASGGDAGAGPPRGGVRPEPSPTAR